MSKNKKKIDSGPEPLAVRQTKQQHNIYNEKK